MFCGDTNVNVFTTNSTTYDYLNCLSRFGFIKQSHSNTRLRSETGLDHFFRKSEDKKIVTNPVILTDHFLIILSIASKKINYIDRSGPESLKLFTNKITRHSTEKTVLITPDNYILLKRFKKHRILLNKTIKNLNFYIFKTNYTR